MVVAAHHIKAPLITYIVRSCTKCVGEAKMHLLVEESVKRAAVAD